MQTCHRTPTIFNLSMVDVLCCALGCVILLWLLNLREAKERAARAGETNEELKSTQDWLSQTYSLLQYSVAEGNDLAQRVRTAAKERDQLRRDLTSGRAELEALTKRLGTLRAQLADDEDRLVDMSGSMDLVDEHTPAPNKWLGVRETLAKVMRSLPDLDKFQVILFSDKLIYLIGKEGRWLDYDPKNSAERVLKALAETKPVGPT